MGQTAKCHAKLGKERSKEEGTAELETDFVSYRSPSLRFKLQFADLVEVQPKGETLYLRTSSEIAILDLGEKAAAKWADKILNPPTRLDKLGIKPAHSILLEGTFDAAFLKEVRKNPTAGPKEADLLFLAAGTLDHLNGVETLAKRMKPTAALWIVYPKGVKQIREIDVISAGRGAGLKDVKVMRFSEKATALKFVVPVAARG